MLARTGSAALSPREEWGQGNMMTAPDHNDLRPYTDNSPRQVKIEPLEASEERQGGGRRFRSKQWN